MHSRFPDVSDVPLSGGAEGSQGTLFCREGREEPFEVSEGGNVFTVKHFTFLEAESEHFYLNWEPGRSEGDWGNDGESDGNRLTRDNAEIRLED